MSKKNQVSHTTQTTVVIKSTIIFSAVVPEHIPTFDHIVPSLNKFLNEVFTLNELGIIASKLELQDLDISSVEKVETDPHLD